MKMLNINRALNLAWYLFRRNNWMIDPRFYLKHLINQEIHKAVFFLGTHGGGLTLTSRMLRRHNRVVSVTGNNNYWSGADEMQVVFGPALPFELSGIKHNLPKSNIHQNHASWLYATDPLIDKYRKTPNDVNKKVKIKLKNIIKYCLHRFGKGKSRPIFVDKSQVFSVRVRYIEEMLRDCNPHFILVTRDPYASCYRAPQKSEGLRRLKNRYNKESLVRYAGQHWSNTMKYALKDGEKTSKFMTIRFENILKNTKKSIKKISEFIGLEYDNRMLPSKTDKVPFGSRFKDRWYPIVENVNHKYYDKINNSYSKIIEEECFPLASKLGYGRRSSCNKSSP